MDRFKRHEPGEWRSFNSVLQWRAEHQSERTAFVYLAEGEREAGRLTFGALDRRARSVAAWLQERDLAGKRIVLLYRAGLDFIVGFLGCLYAGAVAVPGYPPHPRRPDPRLQSILDDCGPEAAFCVLEDYERLSRSMISRGLTIVATDTLTDEADNWKEPRIGLDSLTHLQYTSGSTGHPKGVMVSHGNLLHQVTYVNAQGYCDENTVNVTWQPFFHDMGLVGSVLTSIFCGGVTYVMSPEAFLRTPILWLKAISRYGGTSAPAPNFAYDLCVTRTTPAQREGLDLSTWESAWNGAEPVRADTLDRFCELYEPYGFRRRAFIPCYGLAETTLSTTMDRLDHLPVILSFRRDELERNRAEPCPLDHPSATRLVSSGVMWGDMEIAIVNAETLERCPDGRAGEIWVSGPSVAQGYWQRPDETERTFNAHVSGKNERSYLRTGDLGFLREGELFVTGRLKDMIIIRGRNVYPQDVELVAQQSHEALQIDACAAFSVEGDTHEELALALEVKRTERHRLDPEEVFEAVRGAIGEHFGVAVQWLGLVQPGRVPKTSSGKVMRRECRQQQLSGELSLLAEWRSRTRENREDAAPATATNLVQQLLLLPQSDRHRALVTHLQSEIAHALELRAMPDPRTGFERLGLDSMGAVELVNRLQDELGGKVNLPTTLLFDQPNIEAVATYVEESLFGQLEQSAAPARTDRPLDEPVAVVGLACRFPGAADADEFWQLLDEGRDAIREVPDNRWDIDAYFDPDAGAVGKMNSRFGGFIDDIEGFDAAFFDVSPREATSMDPQHRHLLEVSWLALEDAGIAPSRIDGRPIGVFVGLSTSDYEQILAGRGPETTDAFMATGNAHSAAVGRLSFALGLHGPCVAVDTACSSSLVAVHQAVQSLRQGECEMALAGGVNAVLRPELTVAFCKARLLSPDGRCKTFDAAADGYVRSEGCGMVVLKRLSDAQRDGDRILAVIRGSAVNQDGRSSGLTAPNGPSQTRVIAKALSVARIDPADVQYLECHGTGTVLGDPIEVQAANAILSRGRDPVDRLVIGSVKSNLGHLEAAAGIASLIKVVLALQKAKIPRSLHFRTPNPHIPWASMPVTVATEALAWKSTGSPTRIAGVSSFGFAGTNAHVVVEEAPCQEAETAGDPIEDVGGPHLLAISARTEPGLKDLARRYAVWLRTRDGVGLSDICHTANTGRNHFEHRAVVICDSSDAAQEKLEAIARGESAAGTISGVAPRQHRPRVAFLFPGQGLQYAGMARELYERAPAFRECLDRCAKAYDEFGREDGSPALKAMMFDSCSTELLKQTRYVQPALYALQVSLAALWRSWGVKPDALLGHSAGEYAAACVAGVFRVEDGLRLIVERARLMQTLPSGGTMLSVTAPANTIEAALAGDASVHVSAYNGLNTVISGPIEHLNALIEKFDAQELYCSKLPASNAFHSPSIEPILDDFEAYARRIEYAAPTARLISTMTGKPVAQGEIPDAAYWRHQARQPVRFAQGIQALFEDIGCDVALELGPQAELIWLAQMSWRPEHEVLWASSLAKGRNAFEQMLTSAAQLHANGATLEFASMGKQARGHRRMALPSYPFQHERFWPGPMGGNAPSELHDCFYQVQWRGRGAPSPTTVIPRKQSWLILADEPQLGAVLVEALRTRGQGPVAIASLERGEASAESIVAVLDGARRQGPLDHVVLLASPIDAPSSDAEDVWNAQSRGVIRTLLTAQALISARGNTQLWLVTRGAHAVRDGEAVDPTHSAMWGFGRTFALEHPDRYGGLIDIALDGRAAVIADELAGALLCDDGEKQVALRNGDRWVPRLEHYALPASPAIEVKANATYLITGGTGALGLALARHLAERGAEQIVLTSRSGGNDATRDAVRALGEHGCRVEVIRADVTVRQEVVRLLEQVERITDGRPLRGIIHAAGTILGATIVGQTPESFRDVLAPKVSGAWNLHRTTLDRGVDLDLFVLFSSGASILGLTGHANYAASNAYLDSLAHHRRSLGLPGLSINWGPWDVQGMGPHMHKGTWADVGTRLIQPAIAMLAFDRLANGPSAQVTMHPMDLSRWVNLARSGRLPPILLQLLESLLSQSNAMTTAVSGTSEQQGSVPKVGELVSRFATLGPIERLAALENFIRERVGAVLGIPADNVDLDSGFFDMGMNSIMAVELRSALESGLGKLDKLQAAVVFNYPTVRKLTDYLSTALYSGDEQALVTVRVLDSGEAQAEALRCEASGLTQAIDSVVSEVLDRRHWPVEIDGRNEESYKRKTLAVLLTLQAEVRRLQSRTTEHVAVSEVHYQMKDGRQYTYRRHRPGDKSAAIDSFGKAFGEAAAKNFEMFFDWKYLQNPLTPDDGPFVDVLECGGKIVGMNGGICTRFKIDDTTVSGVWSSDSHVIPEHRNISGWFFHRVSENAPAVLLGDPNPLMYPFAAAMDSITDLAQLVELKAGLDLQALLESRGIGRLLSTICGLLFRAVPNILSVISRIRTGNDISIMEVSEFDSRFDALWQAVAPDYPGIMVRDKTFLSWRFDRCPVRHYTRYVAERNGKIAGYIVTREQRLEGCRRGLIVDFLVRRDDKAALDSLTRRAMQDFAARGIAAVTCPISSTQTEQIRLLRWHGFLFRRHRAHIVVHRGPLLDSITAIKDWFFTFADADGDYNELERES